MKGKNAVCGAIFILAAVAPLGCSDSADPPAQSGISPLRPEAADAVTAVLDSSAQQGDAPGVVALVVGPNGVLFEGTAGKLSASGADMPVDAIFNIASMTKPVTSVAAMMLYEQGQLGLDDPVSKFLPGFDALQVLTSFDPATGAYQTVPATRVMTVRHLLSHTSGIGYGFANATVAQMQQSMQRAEWELPLLNEPGARWNYSASTRVLGRIVEQLSGQSLEEYFQEHIFRPLKMNDTSYAVPADKLARLPAMRTRMDDGGLQESPQNGVPSTPTPPFNGDGGLYSTAHDYGQFMRMFLNGGTLDGARILSERSVQLMGENQIGSAFVELQGANPAVTKPFPLGAGKDKFGLGFEITMPASDDGAHRRAGSIAWAGAFNTEFWIDPQQGIAATLLMQVRPFYDDGAIRALQAFEAALYREVGPRTPQ